MEANVTDAPVPLPGWYPAAEEGQERYWDGTAWTGEQRHIRTGSGLAITGLALSILLAPAGLLVSTVALVRAQRSRQPRGVALAGVIVGSLGTLACAVAVYVALTVVMPAVATVTEQVQAAEQLASGLQGLTGEGSSGDMLDLLGGQGSGPGGAGDLLGMLGGMQGLSEQTPQGTSLGLDGDATAELDSLLKSCQRGEVPDLPGLREQAQKYSQSPMFRELLGQGAGLLCQYLKDAGPVTTGR